MGKLFDESEIKAIAEALGDTSIGLTNSEIDELLWACGIEDQIGPCTKWKRLYGNLWNQQIQRKERNIVLAFIRKSMKPERYLKDPERYEDLRSNLNKALSFAGLFVDEMGKLKASTAVHTLSDAEKRATVLRKDLELRNAHPDVLRFCSSELLSDNYFHAVLEATKSIFDKIKNLTGLHDDGAKLVDKALCGSAPLLAINNLKTESEKSEQTGFANLIKGTYGMFRNPTAHEARIKWDMTKDDAEDLLTLASMIHRRLDKASRIK